MRAAKLSSSMIERLAYDEEERTLCVTFRGSGRYFYYDVPQWVYEAIRSADSAGRYFNEHVKGRFRCRPDPERRRFRPAA